MALVTIHRSSSVQTQKNTGLVGKSIDQSDGTHGTKSLNECYFANKGAAVVLGCAERPACSGSNRHRSPARAHTQPDIQHHLQSMFYLLRPEETLKMAVKLESVHAGRTRYLVVVGHEDEAALLGIDCNHQTTIGLALRVLADTSINLDGDGGFSVCVCGQQHIFKPVSVQAMWSALQTLHRASARARQFNHFAGGASHAWATHYEGHVNSDRSCLNEWHAMDCLESRRPPSPDSLRHKPRERDETEQVIRGTLKEIMMSVDLDEVTSKAIRGRLENDLDMDLAEYKSFIDQEMLTILGQMDSPTEIFDHVYLGSEWNASNLEELRRNGVRHILNVTREIDNFFPGMFDYLNIRVYDDEKTDLLKHWDNTFKYINKAKNEGSKVLVHCKMGISRSASVVIAYAMKAYNWNFDKALRHVKQKRSCIKPNTNFLNQLETYQGILDAMKNKEKLQRSKSETNLKSPKMASKIESKIMDPTPLSQALTGSYTGRPRSWSPDTKLASELLPPTSVSLENLASDTRHILMPCANGSYSVSPNQIIRLKEESMSVKHIVNEIENAAVVDRRDAHRRSMRLNFGNQSEQSIVKTVESSVSNVTEVPTKSFQISPSKSYSHKIQNNCTESNKIHTWDPGEFRLPKGEVNQNNNDIHKIAKCDSGIIDLKSKLSDNHNNSIERAADCEEKRPSDEDILPPSRQSSWSSFDSAVVPDLSRHSSWGSYDTRSIKAQAATREETSSHKRNNTGVEEAVSARDGVPSSERNNNDAGVPQQKVSSDLGIITECVKSGDAEPAGGRARAVAAENERKFNETCAIAKERPGAQRGRSRGAATWCGRLSASAPTESWLRAGLRRRRPASASHGDLPRPRAAPPAAAAAAGPAAAPAAPAGLVSNLKKEFEARSGWRGDDAEPEAERARGARPRARGPARRPDDDLSVKVLVDKYDSHTCRSKCDLVCDANGGGKLSHESVSKKCKFNSESDGRSRTAPSPSLRNSFCGVLGSGGSSERPPIAPNVVSMAPMNLQNMVVSTVMSKAQNKKQLQHGKTHPLTRLNLNRSNNNRCSNPVYNTM